MSNITEQTTLIGTLCVELKELKGTHGLNHVDTVAKNEELEAQFLVLEGLKEEVLVARSVASGYTSVTAGEQ